MPSIEFGSRREANRARALPAVAPHLSDADDRRTTTVKLVSTAPDRVVERLRTESFTRSEANEAALGGRSTLSKSERSALESTGRFDWQKHGLAAMRAKGALEARGVTNFTDFYEPGEGVAGALQNLRESKQRGAQTRAATAVGGQRTDTEEITGGRQQRQQAGRFQSQQVESAKDPALIDADPQAQDFLREEAMFGADVFDISFSRTDRFGRPDPVGADVERLEEFHENRSRRSQRQDERLQAPVTRDPIEWVNAPDTMDFPGIDTLDPEAVHESRSERAQAVDESRSAPLADSVEEWAEEPDQFDLVGVDAMDAIEDPT